LVHARTTVIVFKTFVMIMIVIRSCSKPTVLGSCRFTLVKIGGVDRRRVSLNFVAVTVAVAVVIDIVATVIFATV